MFEGPDKIYWENDEGLGYVMDTGNHDVRTEGMSYAMMIAVQYGRKDVFDKLWGWVMKYMFMTEGLHQGYFAWSVDPSGVPNADGPAPDALDNAIRWVRLLWDTPIRTGTRRYYDNFLYAFAFLALAGEYRVW